MTFFKNYPLVAVLFSTLLFFSCGKEEIIADENDFILKESAFSCQEYQSFQVAGEGQVINTMHQYNNYFLYDIRSFDSSHLEIKNGIDVNTVLKKRMTVRRFLDFENKVLICADEGIYEVDEQLNVNLKVEEPCRDIILTNNNQLLYIGEFITFIKIYYPSIDVSEIYNTFDNSSDLSFFGLFNGVGNTFWAVTDEGELVLFEGPWIKEHYNDSNSSLQTYSWDLGQKRLFPFQYKGEVYFVENRNEGQILMYNNDSLKVLVDISFDNLTENWSELLPLEFYEIMVKGDYLYIGTKGGGVIKCDLTQEVGWGMENLKVYEDPGLPSNYVSYLYAGKNDKVYIVNDKKIVTEIDCF